MRFFPCLLVFVSVLCCGQERPKIFFHGIKIFVSDLEETEEFYTSLIGFNVVSKTDDVLELATNTWPVYLVKTSGMARSGYPKEARTGLTLQTYKLLPAIDALREKNIDFYDTLLARNGVGIAIPFKDPSDNVLSLMEVQVREVSEFAGLRIYNTGVTVNSIENAFAFYGNILGFEEWSRNYLPDALPLKHKDGSFAFMLHRKPALTRATIDHGRHPHIALILESADLEQVKSWLAQQKVSFKVVESRIIVIDPEGNTVEIQETGK
ncbi:MAG: VOC family protein [Cyclobacteriaceae bacterium]